MLIGLFLSMALAAGGYGQTVPELLREGQVAYIKGDVETAKRNFEAVVQLDPKNPTANGYLRQIRAVPPKPSGNTVQKQCESLMMPQVDLKEATFGSALDFVKRAALKQSDGKLVLNFVVQLPDEVVKTRPVSLSLTNVPLSEVLKYIGDLTGSQFDYEKHAIVVRPKAATPPGPAPAAR